MFKRKENALAYQKKLLEDKGWQPVYDHINLRDPEYVDPVLIGWVKEPSMRVYSTEDAYKEELGWELEMKINGEKIV